MKNNTKRQTEIWTGDEFMNLIISVLELAPRFILRVAWKENA